MTPVITAIPRQKNVPWAVGPTVVALGIVIATAAMFANPSLVCKRVAPRLDVPGLATVLMVTSVTMAPAKWAVGPTVAALGIVIAAAAMFANPNLVCKRVAPRLDVLGIAIAQMVTSVKIMNANREAMPVQRRCR